MVTTVDTLRTLPSSKAFPSPRRNGLRQGDDSLLMYTRVVQRVEVTKEMKGLLIAIVVIVVIAVVAYLLLSRRRRP